MKKNATVKQRSVIGLRFLAIIQILSGMCPIIFYSMVSFSSGQHLNLTNVGLQVTVLITYLLGLLLISDIVHLKGRQLFVAWGMCGLIIIAVPTIGGLAAGAPFNEILFNVIFYYSFHYCLFSRSWPIFFQKLVAYRIAGHGADHSRDRVFLDCAVFIQGVFASGC
jgi:hypothetical protein